MSSQTSRITGIPHWLSQLFTKVPEELRRSLLRDAESGGLVTTWIHLAGDAVDLTGANQSANQTPSVSDLIQR
jgi:hypothetical protein